MYRIEQIVGAILGLGIFTYLIGLRVYSLYAGIRESRRGDVSYGSDMQTLFASPTQTSKHDEGEIQALFDSKDDPLA